MMMRSPCRLKHPSTHRGIKEHFHNGLWVMDMCFLTRQWEHDSLLLSFFKPQICNAISSTYELVICLQIHMHLAGKKLTLDHGRAANGMLNTGKKSRVFGTNWNRVDGDKTGRARWGPCH